jgi:hypothetical protein
MLNRGGHEMMRQAARVTAPCLLSLALALASCSADDGGAADGGPGADALLLDGSKADGARPDGAQPDGADTDAKPLTDGATDGATTDQGASTPCAITTFASGKQPAKELHVATAAKGGSDASGDGSAAKPYATLGEAAKHAAPGTAIRVHAGTYSGGTYITGLAGTAQAPIWIGGAPGEAKPIISGSAEGLHLTKVRYLVVHDLEVSGASANGINCDDGGELADPDATRWIVFRGLEIHDIGSGGNQDCLKLSGLDDFWVLDSSFARCGGSDQGSGVDHVGCHRGVLARNRYESTSGNGVQAKGGSTDLVIQNSWFENPGARGVNIGGSTGFQYFRPPLSASADNAEATNIRVLANVFIGGTAPLAFVGCDGCIAAHNTVIDPDKWLVRILQETKTKDGYTFVPARNGLLYNNLFYFTRGKVSTEVNVGANTSPNTFTWENNAFYAHDAPAQSAVTLPGTKTSNESGTDPAFVDASKDDYRLGAGSALRGKGSARDIGILPLADMDGRCIGATPSPGAYIEATP